MTFNNNNGYLVREGDTGTTTQPLFDMCATGSAASSGGDITFTYTLADDTAMAGKDYVPATGQEVINGDHPCVTISAQIIGNVVPEQDRVIKVEMTNLKNGRFLNDQVAMTGEGVIVDDDGSTPVSLTINPRASGWAEPVALTPFGPSYNIADDHDGYTSAQFGDLAISSNIDLNNNILVAWYTGSHGGHQLLYNYLYALQGRFEPGSQLATFDKVAPVSSQSGLSYAVCCTFYRNAGAMAMTHNLFAENWLYWLDMYDIKSFAPASFHAGTPETIPTDPARKTGLGYYGYGTQLVGETDASGRSAVIAASTAPSYVQTDTHYTRSQKATRDTAWSVPTTDEQPAYNRDFYYGSYPPAMITNGQGAQFFAEFYNNTGDNSSDGGRLQIYQLPATGGLGTPEAVFPTALSANAVQLRAGTNDVVALWTGCPTDPANGSNCSRGLYGAVRDATGKWLGPVAVWSGSGHTVNDPYRPTPGQAFTAGSPAEAQLAVNKAGDAVVFFFGCGSPKAGGAANDPENCGYHLAWHRANTGGAWEPPTLIDTTDTLSPLTALRVTLDDNDVVTMAYSAAQDGSQHRYPMLTRTRRLYPDGHQVMEDFADRVLGDLTQRDGHVLLTMSDPETNGHTTSSLYASIFAEPPTNLGTPTIPASVKGGLKDDVEAFLWQPPWSTLHAPFMR